MIRLDFRRTLKKYNVELCNELFINMSCKKCGANWTAHTTNLIKGGRLRKGYWKCPNGCNAK